LNLEAIIDKQIDMLAARLEAKGARLVESLTEVKAFALTQMQRVEAAIVADEPDIDAVVRSAEVNITGFGTLRAIREADTLDRDVAVARIEFLAGAVRTLAAVLAAL